MNELSWKESSVNAKSRKSLHDLRTMGGRVTDAEKPQRRYIRLAILELEKVRRGKERDQASHRIEDIDHRLAEIQGEQAGLLGQATPDPAARPAAPPAGFTIQY